MGKNKAVVEKIKEVPLLKFARKNYYGYGISVLEDRAFPDFRDGMNPVNRRLLWASFEMGIRSNAKFVKSARIVGSTLGLYNPHGDSSVYGALVKMANTNTAVALIQGEGNWGSLSDKSFAAMRYTEARLSKFADEVLFNKFYTPVIDFVPNYDGSSKEPLLLPALLPISIINGRFGIAPGAQTNIPICEYKSVLRALYEIYQGQEITPKYLYKTLKFRSTYGGVEEAVEDEEAAAFRRSVFTSPEGKVTLHSEMQYDEKTHTVTVSKFARDSDMEKLIVNLSDVEGIASVQDASSTKDYYGKLVIQFKKGLKDKQYDLLRRYVKKELSSRESYVLNFTERYVDETGQSAAKVVPMSLTETLTRWVEWRIALERKACQYWINEDAKEIRRLELLLQAVDLIDFILSLLKNEKLDTEQVYETYSKKAKCTVDEAKYVFSRPIISLRKLEKSDLLDQKKKVEANKAKLEKRHKKPEPFMAEQLKDWASLVPKF